MSPLQVAETEIKVVEVAAETIILTTATEALPIKIGIEGPQGGKGPPGTGGVGKESFTPLVDGVRTTFTISNPFINGSTAVYLNGLMQDDPLDYSETVDGIEFVIPPQVGDRVSVVYGTE